MLPHLSALLPYFISVAETGSLTAASRAHAITQPALSRRIHQLETALGTALFRRHARGMSLTSAGEVLLRRARLMQIETQRAIDEIQLLKGEGKGRITISAGPYWCLTILPEVVAEVTRTYPGFTFDVHLAGAKPEVDAVASGRFDLYAGGFDVTYCRGLGLEVVQAATLSYIVFAPPRHPLADAIDIELADLAAHPWVHYHGDGAWPFIVETIQRQADRPVSVQVSSDSLATTLEQAARGACLMGLSQPLADLAARFGLRQLACQPLDFQFPTGFCYGASAKDLPPLALLIEKLEAAVAD
ncbi:MAG: LysR family transcriptional regulator [Roseitalea porphyridii]|jgi:DNA-binding transcriptional LysR family regulator|uniref:LysR family transcriptional regulator n=1 Tax=Roseitalea porphyridii TaxID=1852022 RepID=UPI0032EDE77D